jgi:hypothetical protein
MSGFSEFGERAANETDIFRRIEARLLVAAAHLCGDGGEQT